jgi:hypothetical protein
MTSVKSKEEFLKFMSLLINDLRNNSADWGNKTLAEYLEAIQGWTEDMEGYYMNNNLAPYSFKDIWNTPYNNDMFTSISWELLQKMLGFLLIILIAIIIHFLPAILTCGRFYLSFTAPLLVLSPTAFTIT